jgi:hypothetical protein
MNIVFFSCLFFFWEKKKKKQQIRRHSQNVYNLPGYNTKTQPKQQRPGHKRKTPMSPEDGWRIMQRKQSNPTTSTACCRGSCGVWYTTQAMSSSG